MTKEQFLVNHFSISKEDAIAFLKEHGDEDLPNKYLSKAFECIFINKTTGTTSRPITIAELMELHPSYGLGNGNGWGRADAGYLSKYRIQTLKEERRAVSVIVSGFNTTDARNPATRKIAIQDLEDLAIAANNYQSYKAFLDSCNTELRTETENQIANWEDEMLAGIAKITEKI